MTAATMISTRSSTHEHRMPAISALIARLLRRTSVDSAALTPRHFQPAPRPTISAEGSCESEGAKADFCIRPPIPTTASVRPQADQVPERFEAGGPRPCEAQVAGGALS